jgi:CBS domain-containing protein
MSERNESVMTRKCHTCTETETAQQAAQLMSKHNIGFIPILDNKKHVKGVITDRDLALRVVSEGKQGSTPLKSIMSTDPLVSVRPDETLEATEQRMMERGIGRALVTDKDGTLLGVITRSNIASHENSQRTGAVLGALTRGHRQATRSAT